MSTAGKVLSALTVLMTLVWVLLSATVAQLNRNGTKAVDDLKQQVSKLETDARAGEDDIRAAKNNTYNEQAATQNDLAALQARQSDKERALADVREINSRVKLQLAGVEGMVKSSATLKDERTSEKAAETQAKADAEASVQRLDRENADLLARLTDLRSKFKSTLEQNKGLVQRLNKPKSTAAPKAANANAASRAGAMTR